MAPLGYLPHLKSQKVAHINIEAQGWGETAVSVDVKLKVHDPSGAAGVNIDLIRLAASALRQRAGRLSCRGGAAAQVPARHGDLKWVSRRAAQPDRIGRSHDSNSRASCHNQNGSGTTPSVSGGRIAQ